jgi:predicted amidohydrolase
MSFWGKVMNIEILLEKWFSKKMSLKRIEKYLSNRVKINNNNVDSNLNSTSNSHNNNIHNNSNSNNNVHNNSNINNINSNIDGNSSKNVNITYQNQGEDSNGYQTKHGECFTAHIVKVACVQREIKLVSSIEKYIDVIHDFVKQAAHDKCSLIVFPEYNFFDLFGFIPGFKLLNNFINKRAKQSLNKANISTSASKNALVNTSANISKNSVTNATASIHKSTDTDTHTHTHTRTDTGTDTHTDTDTSIDTLTNGNNNSNSKSNNNNFLGKIFRGIAVPIEIGIKSIMSYFAKEYSIYIYTGSYVLNEGPDVYNVGFLFGPDGKCLGTQRKTHIVEFEKQIGFKRDSKLEVFPFNPEGFTFTDLKIAIPVCMDATYFETFAIARKMGADIVAIPIANMEEYSLWRALRGIWPRVQESYVYGLKASLNGWIAGMHFTGKAGIFAPIGITPHKNGVIALAPQHEGNYLITACLDIQKLYEERSKAEYYGDKNYVFETNLGS